MNFHLIIVVCLISLYLFLYISFLWHYGYLFIAAIMLIVALKEHVPCDAGPFKCHRLNMQAMCSIIEATIKPYPTLLIFECVGHYI